MDLSNVLTTYNLEDRNETLAYDYTSTSTYGTREES
jgi:hypothetical protein